MRAIALSILFATTAQAQPLADNALVKLVGGDRAVAASEVDRLLDQAEVVGFRDGARGATPQALTYAGTVEKTVLSYDIKSERAARVLVDLALALAPLGGPQPELQAERFWSEVVAALGIKPQEAKPRETLAAELAGISAWAERTVEKFAGRLLAPTALLARVQLRVLRGRYAEAAELARSQLATLGPMGHGWLAAALILDGKIAESAPHAARALGAGGEPAALVKIAKAQRAHRAALATVEKSLGSGANVAQACRRFFEKPPGGGGAELGRPSGTGPPSAQGSLAIACAHLLWDQPPRDFLGRAASLVPDGPERAMLRAAELYGRLFSTGRARVPASERSKLRASLDGIIAKLEVPPARKKALRLLAAVAAAPDPVGWQPDNEPDRALLKTVDACDVETWPFWALALRGEPRAVASFARTTVERCATAPQGSAIAVEAASALLELAHQEPPAAPRELAADLALRVARAHPDDPPSIAVHADAVALRAIIRKEPRFALEAALARYEEAIARMTPVGGASLRARLASNAAALSLLIAEGEKDPKRRDPFLARAQKHLRFAMALDSRAATVAVRARFDLRTGLRMSRPPVLDGMSVEQRARAACLLAEQAAGQGDEGGMRRYLADARAAQKSPYPPELLVEFEAAFDVEPEARGLAPATRMHAALYLLPACNADSIKPASATRSTPEPRTAPGK